MFEKICNRFDDEVFVLRFPIKNELLSDSVWNDLSSLVNSSFSDEIVFCGSLWSCLLDVSLDEAKYSFQKYVNEAFQTDVALVDTLFDAILDSLCKPISVHSSLKYKGSSGAGFNVIKNRDYDSILLALVSKDNITIVFSIRPAL